MVMIGGLFVRCCGGGGGIHCVDGAPIGGCPDF